MEEISVGSIPGEERSRNKGTKIRDTHKIVTSQVQTPKPDM